MTKRKIKNAHEQAVDRHIPTAVDFANRMTQQNCFDYGTQVGGGEKIIKIITLTPKQRTIYNRTCDYWNKHFFMAMDGLCHVYGVR